VTWSESWSEGERAPCVAEPAPRRHRSRRPLQSPDNNEPATVVDRAGAGELQTYPSFSLSSVGQLRHLQTTNSVRSHKQRYAALQYTGKICSNTRHLINGLIQIAYPKTGEA